MKPERSIANDLSAYGIARSTIQGNPLNEEEARKIHAFWSACNYLALGMIYLEANPLLRQPLKAEHIKNRLLGHWGASPALSFIYSHLNRVIKSLDLDVIFMAGPGHGAPGVLAPLYLEGSYSEIYPDRVDCSIGLRRSCHRDRERSLHTVKIALDKHSENLSNPVFVDTARRRSLRMRHTHE